MATQEVLKHEVEIKEESIELGLETLFHDEPSDALSRFEKNMLRVMDLNTRLSFMLSEVKDLLRK